MVSARGIDANPKKVATIEQLRAPRIRREIQKLACMVAALSRLISKLGRTWHAFLQDIAQSG
jgi:hypothetical protein